MTSEPGIAALAVARRPSLFARVKPEYETTIIAINGEFPFLNGHS
jgi:hypothetical protein